MTGYQAMGFIGNDEAAERHIAAERVRIEKPKKVVYHGREYYDLTPYFNMDSSKVVMQRKPENTPERRKELRRREAEKYHLTRTWSAE